jgi:hypothetical protein
MTKRTLKDTASDKLAKSIDDKAGGNSDFKMINTRLDKDLIMAMKLHCVKEETTIQNFINEAIRARLEDSK